MYLLNARTYRLQSFAGDTIPQYAILSHTWGEEEVTYQDILSVQVDDGYALVSLDSTNDEWTSGEQIVENAWSLTSMRGFEKIQYACEQALRDGWGFVWVDTCCIDKTSSAELSEAINSMYQWYKKAEICYAYMVDVHESTSTINGSRWFTRGWTLQELLAPKKIHFFSAKWSLLGSKSEMQDNLSSITGVPIGILSGKSSLQSCSVAQRMSWASRRHTTRVEDIAYCLLGIFNVNMPLIYGEGESAFTRLQEQIISNSDDQSIFAWGFNQPNDSNPRGLFARSPSEFSACSNIVPFFNFDSGKTFKVTNRGIKMKIPVFGKPQDGKILACLACRLEGTGVRRICFLTLRSTSIFRDDQYVRVGPPLFREVLNFNAGNENNYNTIFVKKGPLVYDDDEPVTYFSHGFHFSEPSIDGFKLTEIYPKNYGELEHRRLEKPLTRVELQALRNERKNKEYIPSTWNVIARLERGGDQFALRLGCDIFAANEWCEIIPIPAGQELELVYKSSHTPVDSFVLKLLSGEILQVEVKLNPIRGRDYTVIKVDTTIKKVVPLPPTPKPISDAKQVKSKNFNSRPRDLSWI